MKKLLAMLLALSLVVFTGCSGDTKKEKEKKTEKTGGEKPGAKAKPDDSTKVDTKLHAKGKIKSIEGNKVVVDVDGKDETFTLDKDALKGAKVGDTIDVTYTKKGDQITVTAVKTEKGAEAPKPDKLEAKGKVKSVEGDKVVVDVDGKDMTFTVDKDALKGIKKDDMVEVTYTKKGDNITVVSINKKK